MNVSEPMVIHYVRDMADAVRFYREVFEVEVLAESPGWSELDFQSIKVALHGLFDGMSEQPMPHAGLNFMVESIEAMQSRIEAHGGELLSLREAGDGVPVRVAEFRDCAGNGFELRQVP